MIKTTLCSFLLLLTSCASLQPKEYSLNINLVTLDIEKKPIDAVCSLYSSSSKLDILSPKKLYSTLRAHQLMLFVKQETYMVVMALSKKLMVAKQETCLLLLD